jgi:hypothetical protein
MLADVPRPHSPPRVTIRGVFILTRRTPLVEMQISSSYYRAHVSPLNFIGNLAQSNLMAGDELQ